LNREKRLRELLRITKENQEILKRIQMQKAKYNREKLEKDWHHNEQLMDQIAAYPRLWWLTEKEVSY
jgi:hypothetical protein